jgi:Caspase domain
MIERLASIAAVIGAAILSVVAVPDVAWAGKRVALIVGNSAYQTVPQLPNPSRDAGAVAKMLEDAGFDMVDVQLNVGNLEFKRAIRRFEATADQADIAVVYYAGHGLEIGGANYLIPVDARLASDRDADDEAIPLERLVSSADGAKRLRLVILDACRDNPFVSIMRRERKVATRAVVAGLGKVEPTSTDTLIAYAAKAGSTADDGDGFHSPFTAAVLKNLTVPGLDVRLAFGRVRDEVLKVTANRQEPFVYGSLGGGNISLVPVPPVPQDTPVGDVKADYELVQKVGTKRAWGVFLGTHPTGFYAELARAQIEQLNNQPTNDPTPAQGGNMAVAALPPDKTAPSRDSASKEAVEWDRVKDSTEPAALRKFIKRFPESPLANNAQQRIDVLNQAAEAAKRVAEQQKAEAAAQKKRDDDERRAREAEAAEKARAAAAEVAAQKKRDGDERRAAAAEADRRVKAAEARQKAEQADRDKAVTEAAAARAAADKQAREAEAARKTAELAAAREVTCKDEQGKLDALVAKGSEGTGVDDLKGFSRTVTCDRLGPMVVAALDRFNADAAKRAASLANSPQLVRSAQTELLRLGCLTGKVDGTLNDPTRAALGRYLSIGGQPTDNISVTDALVTELTRHTTRVCPIECEADKTLKGEICVAYEKPGAPSATVARKSDDEKESRPSRRQASRDQERDQPRRSKPSDAAPRAKQQAQARPSIVSGGGHAIIGVGF